MNKQRSFKQYLDWIWGPRFHIAVWPCLSQTDPEIAMGIFTVLACLIEYLVGEESSDSIPRERTSPYIYRNFVKMEREPRQYRWSIQQSQFNVGEWEHNNPNQNVMVWGNLQRSEGRWQLQVDVKNDLAEKDTNTLGFSHEEAYLRDLVGHLPQIAYDTVTFLGINISEALPSFANCTANEESIRELLAYLFYWERQLQLMTWGIIWPDKQSVDDFETLLKLGQNVGGEFGAWGVSLMLARALRPHFREVGVAISRYIHQVLKIFPDSAVPIFHLSKVTLKLAIITGNANLARVAFDLMETAVKKNPHHLAGWETLLDLYRLGNKFKEGVETFQRALEVDCTSEYLYLSYAQLLSQAHEVRVKRLPLILTNADENQEAPITWEIFAAYEAILDDNPKNVEALSRQLKQVLNYKLKADWFWSKFEQLVELDETGRWVRKVINDLFFFDVPPTPAIQILKRTIEKYPNRVDLRFNLADIHLIDENKNAALISLRQARELTDDPWLLTEIDHAIVIVQNPLKFKLSLDLLEIVLQVRITPGREKLISTITYHITTEQVDSLENAIDQMPTFYGGYMLLAAAYLVWDDPEAALEVLLDGQRHLPDNPNITWFLAALLRDLEEQKLAWDYLNIGLEKNPKNVNLLAMKSLLLFDLGAEEQEEFEILFRKAHRIEPRASFFIHVHDYIVWEREEQE